jgi:hypothetical protein
VDGFIFCDMGSASNSILARTITRVAFPSPLSIPSDLPSGEGSPAVACRGSPGISLRRKTKESALAVRRHDSQFLTTFPFGTSPNRKVVVMENRADRGL